MTGFTIGITYFFSLLASLTLFYCVGKAVRWYWVRSFVPKKFFSDIFFSLLVGQIVSVFLYTVFCSRGQTIQWVFLVPAFFIVRKLNKNQEIVHSSHAYYPKLLAILAAVLICFLWEAIFFLRTDGFPFTLTFIDNVYYSKISHFLGVTGQESYWCMENYVLGKATEGIALYHFYEMWLSSLLSRLFGLLTLPTFLLVAQPTFHCIGLIGVLALIEHLYPQFNIFQLIIAFLLLFVSAVYFQFYGKIEFLKYADIIFFNFLGHVSKKTGIYYVLLLAFVLLLHQKQRIIAFSTLFCLPIMTVTAFPFLVGGMSLMLFISFVFKMLERKEVYVLALFLFVFVVSYLGIYLLLRDTNAVMTPTYALSGFLKNNLGEWWTKIKLIIGTGMQIGLLLSPFVLLILVSLKPRKLVLICKEHSIAFIFSLACLLAGLMTWAVLNQIEDMFQLFIGTLSILNVIIIYLIISYVKIFSSSSWKQWAINSLLYIILIYNIYQQVERQRFQYPQRQSHLNLYAGYSEKYLIQLSSMIKKETIKGLGGSLIAKADYERSPYTMMPHIMRLGEYLGLMSNDCYTVSLNDLDLPDNKLIREHYLIKLPFFYFVEEQKKQGEFKDIDSSQIAFIQKYQVRFLIVSKNAQISKALRALVKETIIDEMSGEKFLLLF